MTRNGYCPQAILARVEQIVDLLSNRVVSEDGFKLDTVAAEAAVDYCRRLASGEAKPGEYQTPEEAALIDFISNHGQSLDWVFRGDPSGMICRLAKSPPPQPAGRPRPTWVKLVS